MREFLWPQLSNRYNYYTHNEAVVFAIAGYQGGCCNYKRIKRWRERRIATAIWANVRRNQFFWGRGDVGFRCGAKQSLAASNMSQIRGTHTKPSIPRRRVHAVDSGSLDGVWSCRHLAFLFDYSPFLSFANLCRREG